MPYISAVNETVKGTVANQDNPAMAAKRYNAYGASVDSKKAKEAARMM
jgi:hypothetical protein